MYPSEWCQQYWPLATPVVRVPLRIISVFMMLKMHIAEGWEPCLKHQSTNPADGLVQPPVFLRYSPAKMGGAVNCGEVAEN